MHRRKTHPRRSLAMLGVVLSSLIATACSGGDDGGSAPVPAVAAANEFCTNMEFVRDNWGTSPERVAELGGEEARTELLQAALRDGGAASPERSAAFERLAFLIGPEPTRPRSEADLNELGFVTSEVTRITSAECGFDPLF